MGGRTTRYRARCQAEQTGPLPAPLAAPVQAPAIHERWVRGREAWERKALRAEGLQCKGASAGRQTPPRTQSARPRSGCWAERRAFSQGRC